MELGIHIEYDVVRLQRHMGSALLEHMRCLATDELQAMLCDVTDGNIEAPANLPVSLRISASCLSIWRADAGILQSMCYLEIVERVSPPTNMTRFGGLTQTACMVTILYFVCRSCRTVMARPASG